MKFKKICLFLIIFHMIAMQAIDQEISNQTTKPEIASNDNVQKKESVKTDTFKEKSVKKQAPKDLAPLQKTMFVNTRVNEIVLVITNHKNKQFQVRIKMGHHYTYHYQHPAIKVVCYEKLTPKTTLNKNDLETYTAFVFNDNQKTDKYHHISIHEKNKALKHTRQSGDISLFNDVCEETIYNL